MRFPAGVPNDRDTYEPALERERLLAVRAHRRLVEHELTRRRTLLALCVFLSTAAVVLAAFGHEVAGAGALFSAVASGGATIPRRTEAHPQRQNLSG